MDIAQNFEKILNNCFIEMKNHKMKYMVSIEKQNELVSNKFKEFNFKQKDLSIIANFIYTKINKYDYLNIQYLYNYLLDYYNTKEYQELLDMVGQLKLEKQSSILDKLIDITYCKEGYIKTIEAIKSLIDSGSYKKFSRIDLNDTQDSNKTNYRTLISQNIEPTEIQEIIIFKLRKMNVKYNYKTYIEDYVNVMTENRQSYLLSEVIKNTLFKYSKEKCLIALNNYLGNKRITDKSLSNKDNKQLRKLNKYLNPLYVLTIIKKHLIKQGVDITDMTNNDIMLQYIDNFCNKVEKKENNITLK